MKLYIEPEPPKNEVQVVKKGRLRFINKVANESQESPKT